LKVAICIIKLFGKPNIIFFFFCREKDIYMEVMG